MHRICGSPVAILLAVIGGAGPTHANDSSSELAAGGLVLTKTDAITVQREDLTLAPAEVRVRYEMRNDTGKPVTLRVAFPMPEVPKLTPAGMQTAAGGYNIHLDPPTDVNFIGFRVWSNGHPVIPETDLHATLPNGRDVTAALRAIGGTALLLQPRLFTRTSDRPDGWDLPAATRRQLAELGALKQDADAYETLWTTHITFHWEQTFRPGVTVIKHSYRPILGSQLLDAPQAGAPGRADAAHWVWRGSADADLARAYCIDAATDRALRSDYARLLTRRPANGDASMGGYMLGYILTTARNWRGRIGTFHLTVQGGRIDPAGQHPEEARLLSLCTDLPLRQTEPMRYEATVKDYLPTADLRVLIIAD